MPAQVVPVQRGHEVKSPGNSHQIDYQDECTGKAKAINDRRGGWTSVEAKRRRVVTYVLPFGFLPIL